MKHATIVRSAKKSRQHVVLRRATLMAALLFGGAALAAFSSGACGGKKPPVVVDPPEEDAGATAEPVDAAPPAPKSLWERLGGKDAVGAVVDELLVNSLADNRINKFFEKVKKDEAKKKALREVLVAFICDKTGGTDCNYTGKSMKDSHKDMKLTEAHWNAFIEDLKIALASKGVSDDLQTELLGELAKTKGDIVTPKK